MFDISVGQLLLLMVVGLVVLGPQRLPVAIRTVSGWIQTLRRLSMTVQTELMSELKLQEMKDALAKIEHIDLDLNKLSPELQQTVDELKKSRDQLDALYQESRGSIESPVNSGVHNEDNAVDKKHD